MGCLYKNENARAKSGKRKIKATVKKWDGKQILRYCRNLKYNFNLYLGISWLSIEFQIKWKYSWKELYSTWKQRFVWPVDWILKLDLLVENLKLLMFLVSRFYQYGPGAHVFIPCFPFWVFIVTVVKEKCEVDSSVIYVR